MDLTGQKKKLFDCFYSNIKYSPTSLVKYRWRDSACIGTGFWHSDGKLFKI